MKKVIKTINKPIVLIAALIAGIAVVLAKIFITKENDDKDE
ncbi:MAG: hypothetical protein Q8Q23_02275 [bacterium]|nr:hypothetical protein [bacterium]